MPDQPNNATDDPWSIPAPGASAPASGVSTADLFGELPTDPAHSPDDPPRERRRSSTRERRTDWRLGGRTVWKWRLGLLAVALVSLGVTVLLAALVTWLWPSPWAVTAASAILWIGMLVAIVWAFGVSRPIGLLRFRGIDLLYAVVLGVTLRTVQGWLAASAGSGAFPVAASVGGDTGSWWLQTALPAVSIAPLVEEFFFRAVVLICVYTLLRKKLGGLSAGTVALLVSTALFVLVHALTAPTGSGAVVSLALLGLVCSLLVLLTGRIWGAVLVHLSYNATYVVLAMIGTAFA